MTSVQLKRKKENQGIIKIFECSASRETKRLKAKKAELLKDFIDKKTLQYFYVCYTTNTNALFLQVNHLDFRVLFPYINSTETNALFNSHIIIWS